MPGSFSQEDVSIEAPLFYLVTNTLTGYTMLRHFVRPVAQQLDVWVHAQTPNSFWHAAGMSEIEGHAGCCVKGDNDQIYQAYGLWILPYVVHMELNRFVDAQRMLFGFHVMLLPDFCGADNKACINLHSHLQAKLGVRCQEPAGRELGAKFVTRLSPSKGSQKQTVSTMRV